MKRVVLHRPGWEPQAGDDWHRVACLKAAADALPQGARPFLALGRQHIAPFRHRPDLRPVLRMVDEPGDLPFPADLVLGKPGDEGAEALSSSASASRISSPATRGAKHPMPRSRRRDAWGYPSS